MPMTLRAVAAVAGTLTAVAVLVLTLPMPVTAQTVPPALEQSAPLNEAEIKSFAAAAVEVKRVTDSYLPALARAQTMQEKERVEGAAFEEIKQVVEHQGFTISRFNQILALAHVSQELQDQIRRHLPQ
jgi:hypothetical protein